MAKGSKGYRRKTRHLRVKLRNKGKVQIRKYMQKFDEGETVAININPRYQNIPHPRFQGKGGKIVKKQGRAYHVRIRDGNKIKQIISNPEHLVKLH
ncbi:MAG: 50S ribosomal protein L21e [Candidatus Altiarchaeales archaeon HGW-Altiarchaeales-2]|nr:MAG: 50S ribosomal protein L21e [Candidatus Altiarchaeales archaeon HGW-Altiarchaeales-2]